jgi:hypothetical protein
MNGSIASLVGAYLGELMIRDVSGHWGWMPARQPSVAPRLYFEALWDAVGRLAWRLY